MSEERGAGCCDRCRSFGACMNQCELAQKDENACGYVERPVPQSCPANGCGGFTSWDEDEEEEE